MAALFRYAIALTVLSGIGCSPDSVSVPSEHAREEEAASLPTMDAAAKSDRLPPGGLVIDLDASGVRLRANRASRTAALVELARRANFSITGADRVVGEFTGWFTAPTPEHAAGLLASGLGYTATYAITPGGHLLARVDLGTAAAPGPLDGLDGTRISVGAPMSLADGDARSTRLHERWLADHADAANLLGNPDPEVRISALGEFDAAAGGLVALDRALASEPDAGVRIALLHKLDESGSVIALQSILRGLDDPEPEVVITAIRLAQDWHDEELVERYVQPLLDHGDMRVRAAATDAIDSVRE